MSIIRWIKVLTRSNLILYISALYCPLPPDNAGVLGSDSPPVVSPLCLITMSRHNAAPCFTPALFRIKVPVIMPGPPPCSHQAPVSPVSPASPVPDYPQHARTPAPGQLLTTLTRHEAGSPGSPGDSCHHARTPALLTSGSRVSQGPTLDTIDRHKARYPDLTYSG